MGAVFQTTTAPKGQEKIIKHQDNVRFKSGPKRVKKKESNTITPLDRQRLDAEESRSITRMLLIVAYPHREGEGASPLPGHTKCSGDRAEHGEESVT